MEWLESLRGKTVGLDSAPIIYYYIAQEAARLRASYNIRTPDAIQLATAITAGASFFLTNDLALPSLPNIKILNLDDLKKET